MNSTRMAALLREAMTPSGPPVAKADPARAAMIKALATPPLPSGTAHQPESARPRPFPQMAHALAAENVAAAETQGQILQAYRAIAEMEPVDSPETIDSAAGRQSAAAAAADSLPPGRALPLAKVDETAGMRPPIPALTFQPNQPPPMQTASGLTEMTRSGPYPTKAGPSRAARRLEPLQIPGFGVPLLLVGLLAAAAALVVLTTL